MISRHLGVKKLEETSFCKLKKTSSFFPAFFSKLQSPEMQFTENRRNRSFDDNCIISGGNAKPLCKFCRRLTRIKIVRR